MVHSKVGQLIRVAGVDIIETREGEAGCVLYGPYLALAPGSYQVDFNITASSSSRVRCCRVDILASGARKVAERKVLASELAKFKGVVTLAFDVAAEEVFEFRVFSTGKLALRVQRNRPVRLMTPLPSGASNILTRSGSRVPELFKAHFAAFADLQAKGFSFRAGEGESVVATYKGVSFTIENSEDFQLVGEIFLINEYNIVTQGDAIAIDVGMNAGLTSLYLAGMSHVRQVYAFEPFQAPFRRAARNFALNPALDAKIERQRFGLADADAVSTVLASRNSTIGVSIYGASQGDAETIEVRNAAEVLGPILRQAAVDRRSVILKVDCEGSEFGIFRVLDESGLVEHVNAIVCEWHKWWDPGRTQADLIDPLLRRGFLVIDRTNPADPYAGLFYAVRTAQPNA